MAAGSRPSPVGGGNVLAWDLDAATGVPRPLPLAGSAEGGALTLAFRPEGALGNPHQDLWLLRRPA